MTVNNSRQEKIKKIVENVSSHNKLDFHLTIMLSVLGMDYIVGKERLKMYLIDKDGDNFDIDELSIEEIGAVEWKGIKAVYGMYEHVNVFGYKPDIFRHTIALN